jgi:hypothetical protein
MNTSHGLPGRINYKDCLHDRDDFHQTAWGDLDSVSETHGNQALPDLLLNSALQHGPTQRPDKFSKPEHVINECKSKRIRSRQS